MQKTIKYTCPNCQQQHNVTIYPVINLQTDKELYDDLFSLNLFKTQCNKCKKTIIIQYDCLIVDMFKKYIIYLCASESLNTFNQDIDNFVKQLKNNQQYKDVFDQLRHTRVVTSLNQLLEKLLIFDYDLNDKIIEILKLGLYDNERLDKESYKSVCFNKIEGDKLIFTCFNINDSKVQPIDITVDIKYYNKIIDSIGGVVPNDDNYFEYINDSWAILKTTKQ